MNLFRHAETTERYRQCYLCNEVKPDDFANFGDRFASKTSLCCRACVLALPPVQRLTMNPMETVRRKPCKKCGQVKLNTFDNFGAKLWRTRSEQTTVDVCLACTAARRTGTLLRRQDDGAELAGNPGEDPIYP